MDLGLYSTDYGREALRRAYRLYLTLRGQTHWKVASSLATPIPPQFGRAPYALQVNEREVDALSKALKRWAEENKAELYRGDERDRVLKALEALILTEPEIETVLRNEIESHRRHEVGTVLSRYFYGGGGQTEMPPAAKLLREKLVGLFEIQYPATAVHDSKRSVRYISATRKYLLFERAPNFDALIVHSFRLTRFWGSLDTRFTLPDGTSGGDPDDPETPLPAFKSRQSGFAFPTENGEVHCLMSDYGPPQSRTYTILSPTDRDYSGCSGFRADDLAFDVAVAPYKFQPRPRYDVNRPGFSIELDVCLLRRPDRMVERYITVASDKLRWSAL